MYSSPILVQMIYCIWFLHKWVGAHHFSLSEYNNIYDMTILNKQVQDHVGDEPNLLKL